MFVNAIGEWPKGFMRRFCYDRDHKIMDSSRTQVVLLRFVNLLEKSNIHRKTFPTFIRIWTRPHSGANIAFSLMDLILRAKTYLAIALG